MYPRASIRVQNAEVEWANESYETLDRLMAMETDESGRPSKKIFIRTIRLTDIPRDAEETQSGR